MKATASMIRLIDAKIVLWVLLTATVHFVVILSTVAGDLLGSSLSGNSSHGGVRIVNGDQANPGDFPFVASLRVDAVSTCGATFFTSSRLYTACHCLIKYPHHFYKYPNHVLQDPGKIEVVAGSIYNDVEWYQEGISTYGKALKVHPKCEHNKTGTFYDYGVIEVDTPFTLSKGVIEVVPVSEEVKGQISQAIMNPDNLHCQAAGWGSIEEKTEPVFILHKADMKLMTHEWCEKSIYELAKDAIPPREWKFVRDIQVCAVGHPDNQTTCDGDDGGPLICGTEKKIIVGVLTGRTKIRKCTRDDNPNIYARLDFAMDWIINAFLPEPTPNLTTVDPMPTKPTTTSSFSPIHSKSCKIHHSVDIFTIGFLLIKYI